MKRIIKTFTISLVSLLFIVIILFYFYPSLFIDFYIGVDEKSIWVKTKPITFNFKITETASRLCNLEWSPNKKYLVYIDDVSEILYDKEYFIKVINPRLLKTKTIFIGTYHTSYYRWLNNNTIRVYVGAGSGVRVYRDINIHLKEPFIAIDHLEPKYWIAQAWEEYDD